MNLQKVREENGHEPVFYHSLPTTYFGELIHSLSLNAVFDMTPGSGEFGLVSIIADVRYFAVCFTEEHMNKLHSRLVDCVLTEFADQKSPLFQPKMQVVQPLPKKMPKVLPFFRLLIYYIMY